jgi:hypothetical protein
MQSKSKPLRLLLLLPFDQAKHYPMNAVRKYERSAEEEEGQKPAMPDMNESHAISSG